MSGEPNSFDEPDVAGYLSILSARVNELEATFRHRHVRSNIGDACATCGLDLRDRVHLSPVTRCKNCGQPQAVHPVSPEMQCPGFRPA